VKPRKKMNVSKIKPRPVRLSAAGKRDVRTQFAALCWRKRRDDVQVLLVTSRRTGRWVIPKGWPMDGLTPTEAAGQEAWEEAGAEGKVNDTCLGVFTYTKNMEDDDDLPCAVAVFPMKVKKTRSDWPEVEARKRKWFSLKKAASQIHEPELQRILLTFDPARLVA